MLALYILGLMILLYILTFREGFIWIDNHIHANEIDALHQFIDSDLASLTNGEKMLYVIYKSRGNKETQKEIDIKIHKKAKNQDFKITRVFVVKQESAIHSLFNDYYAPDLLLDDVVLLTNNISTVPNGTTRIVDYVNTSSNVYKQIKNIIRAANNNI